MKTNDLAKQILADIYVELTDEFARNFERKAFFDKPWEERKRTGRGSLLLVSGRLRRSIRACTTKNSIRFMSDCEYADIHNAGGTILVTSKMKKYFWAMYYKNQQGLYMSIKTKDYKTKTNIKKNAEAEFWANMARAKKITIPQRQFIGKHPKVDNIVREIANNCTKEYINKIFDNFKKQLNQ